MVSSASEADWAGRRCWKETRPLTSRSPPAPSRRLRGRTPGRHQGHRRADWARGAGSSSPASDRPAPWGAAASSRDCRRVRLKWPGAQRGGAGGSRMKGNGPA
eukprot:2939353-Pyramimonas_sp.AAC.1